MCLCLCGETNAPAKGQENRHHSSMSVHCIYNVIRLKLVLFIHCTVLNNAYCFVLFCTYLSRPMLILFDYVYIVLSSRGT